MEFNENTMDQVSSMEKDSRSAPQSPSNYQANSFHFNPPPISPGRPSVESTWSPNLRPTLFHHCIASLRSHKGSINAIAVLRSGLVLTASDSTRICAWRRLDGEDIVDYVAIKASSSSRVKTMLAHRDMLFTSHRDNKIRVLNTEGAYGNDKFSLKKITNLPKRPSSKFPFFSRGRSRHAQQQHSHRDVISSMAYYHAEDILYTGSWDKCIKAWRISEQKCIDSFYAHGDNINALVVNQEDGCLFSASSDGTVKIWRRRDFGGCSHNLTMTLKSQFSPINALALSVSRTSGTFLYSGSSDGCTNFWVKEKLHSCFYNHCGMVESNRFAILCLMATDNLVISGSEDTTIRVWKRLEEKGSLYHECLVVLEGHRGPITCVNACVEMDNHEMLKSILIYSASLDQTFKVWRVKVMPEINDTYVSDTIDYIENGDGGGGCWSGAGLECEMSPVLSPSWLEKNFQVGRY